MSVITTMLNKSKEVSFDEKLCFYYVEKSYV